MERGRRKWGDLMGETSVTTDERNESQEQDPTKTLIDGGEEDQGLAHDIGRGTAIGDTGRAHARETGKGGGHEAEIIKEMTSGTAMMGVVRTHEIEPTDAANVGVDPHTSVLILAHGGEIDGKKMEISTIH